MINQLFLKIWKQGIDDPSFKLQPYSYFQFFIVNKWQKVSNDLTN